MVQFKILSGKKAGTAWVARRFPVRVGRSREADLVLEEDGVWDQHLLVRFVPKQGVVVGAEGEALATVNGEPIREAVLRNGDALEIGSAKLQFWLSETRHRSLGLREALGWGLTGGVVVAEAVLLYWLLQL